MMYFFALSAPTTFELGNLSIASANLNNAASVLVPQLEIAFHRGFIA